MSHWDSEKQVIVRWESHPVEDYPGWEWIDCGCCGGLEWGGEEPRECNNCNGSGRQAKHRSGTYAVYPGGLFKGRDRKHGAA